VGGRSRIPVQEQRGIHVELGMTDATSQRLLAAAIPESIPTATHGSIRRIDLLSGSALASSIQESVSETRVSDNDWGVLLELEMESQAASSAVELECAGNWWIRLGCLAQDFDADLWHLCTCAQRRSPSFREPQVPSKWQQLWQRWLGRCIKLPLSPTWWLGCIHLTTYHLAGCQHGGSEN
jgi:hypothetical protein